MVRLNQIQISTIIYRFMIYFTVLITPMLSTFTQLTIIIILKHIIPLQQIQLTIWRNIKYVIAQLRTKIYKNQKHIKYCSTYLATLAIFRFYSSGFPTFFRACKGLCTTSGFISIKFKSIIYENYYLKSKLTFLK